MCDSYNLRKDVSFETKIYPGVYWVPYNSLGKTHYTNDQMSAMAKEEIAQKIENIYELAQYVQVNDFRNKIDISFEDGDSGQWEIHKSGMDVLVRREGCCSSYSGLAVYILKGKIGSIYNFCVVSDTGWGHAMNYIEYKGYYYFFDISSQLNEFQKYVPVETGNKQDFVRAKFITGGCYKVSKVEDFIHFFLRYHMFKMTDFIFYTLSAVTIPPILIEKKDICYVYFSENEVHNIYEYDKQKRIKYISRAFI